MRGFGVRFDVCDTGDGDFEIDQPLVRAAVGTVRLVATEGWGRLGGCLGWRMGRTLWVARGR